MSKNCILIHGAWYASWVWKYVAPALAKASGYQKVLTPDLPGHGSNVVVDYKNITLETYVGSITQLVQSLTGPVVLVGHSVAGIVISQVAENISNKIDRLIYVAGFIPENQGTLVDEERQAKIKSVALEAKIN